jgi:glycosyltransferase involved in cell wall biosynthesis
MILLSHPFGNQNVRQALRAFNEANLLQRFSTSVYWDSTWLLNRLLPEAVKAELGRRSYPEIAWNQVSLHPIREAFRLILAKCGVQSLSHPESPFSAVKADESTDRFSATIVERGSFQAVYAYEGAAVRTFKAARKVGTKCIYELPFAYWRHVGRLLKEESELKPEYAETMPSIIENQARRDAKDEELSLADQIVVPSDYVRGTLATAPGSMSPIATIPYGAEASASNVRRCGGPNTARLKVLFAGQLTQRKGIGYVLEAINKLGDVVQFTMIGQRVGRCAPIEEAIRSHRWIPTMPHGELLSEMSRHDVLVLPSISEAFGLVVLEAMSRGLPVITTRNCGAAIAVRDGIDGFTIPIRSVDDIVDKLALLAGSRTLLDDMSCAAAVRASVFSWERYRELLCRTVEPLLYVRRTEDPRVA